MTKKHNRCSNRKCRNPATENIQFEEAGGTFINEKVCQKCGKLHELIQAASNKYYSVVNVQKPEKFIREREGF